MRHVLDAIEAAVRPLPTSHRPEFITAMVTVCLAMIRDGEGDEFLRGYLEAALADLDVPKAVSFSIPTSH